MKAFEAKAKMDIPLEKTIIKEGEKITVTEISNKFYLWHKDGIYVIDHLYLGETLRTLSDNDLLTEQNEA